MDPKRPPRVTLPPDPVIDIYKKDGDRSLLRENLKLTVEERFRKLMAMHRFADEVRLARKRGQSGE